MIRLIVSGGLLLAAAASTGLVVKEQQEDAAYQAEEARLAPLCSQVKAILGRREGGGSPPLAMCQSAEAGVGWRCVLNDKRQCSAPDRWFFEEAGGEAIRRTHEIASKMLAACLPDFSQKPFEQRFFEPSKSVRMIKGLGFEGPDGVKVRSAWSGSAELGTTEQCEEVAATVEVSTRSDGT